MPGFALQYLQVSVTMGFLALLLKLLSQKINKTFDARLKYWAWLLIALRLLIPFRIPIPSAALTVALPVADTGAATVTEMLPAVGGAGTNLPGAAPLSLGNMLIIGWLTGFMIYCSYQLIRYLSQKRRLLRWSTPLRHETLLAQIEMERHILRISRRVQAFVCKDIGSPTMVGFVWPKLLLPKVMLELPYSESAFVLRHEMIHLKRNDLWYKLLLILATGAHWFNPAAHIMLREASADLEISCDARVVKGGGMRTRKAYFETILGFMSTVRQEATLSTHFNGGTRMMEKRFVTLIDGRKRKRGVMVFITLFLAVSMAGSLIGTTLAANDEQAVVRGWMDVYRERLETGWQDAFSSELTVDDLPVEDALLIALQTVVKAAELDYETLAQYEPYAWFSAYVDGRHEWVICFALYSPEGGELDNFYISVEAQTGKVLVYQRGGRG